MDQNNEYVICRICGKALKSINHLHLKKHDITFEEYVKKFPESPTCSENTKLSRSQKLIGREISWKNKISKSNKLSWIKNPGQGRTGVALSEESSKKLSKKMQGHCVSKETRRKIGESGKGREPWNKGLTKFDDKRLKSISEKVSEYSKNMPQEIKDRISQTLKRKYANVMKVPNAKSGFRADLRMTFRSSWEANYARVLKIEKRDILYEIDRFPLYKQCGKIDCVYVTDFKLGHNHYLEIKGHCRSADNWECECKRCQRDKRKLALMSIQYPNIRIDMMGKKEYRELCEEYFGCVENWEKTPYDPQL